KIRCLLYRDNTPGADTEPQTNCIAIVYSVAHHQKPRANPQQSLIALPVWPLALCCQLPSIMHRAMLEYGHHHLQQKWNYCETDNPELDKLSADMWETMEKANGCGLASPQIGLPVRLFIVDSKSTFDNLREEERKFYFPQDDKGIMETFINAKIIQ